ncbi:Trimethyllysine dioxygenase [Amniculicola lignicola CBS 123094]|uniref:Trimethyllysine dioxygenase n=1 Tax=Amniculicola lignicola CBS 123094 TaxID=1392246 RepID=A0A6A5WGM3_9PLEO|nr:Trimethyllysine dioxygenase [Amniculicola lignicola CBS 123094]
MSPAILPRALMHRAAPKLFRMPSRSLYTTNRTKQQVSAVVASLQPDKPTSSRSIPDEDKIVAVDMHQTINDLATNIDTWNRKLKSLLDKDIMRHQWLAVSTPRDPPINPESHRANVVAVHVEDHTLSCNVGGALTKIPNIWLRDNCQCDKCVHAATRQRLLDTFDIPPEIAIESHAVNGKEVHITWNDGHQSSYSLDFFSQACSDPLHRAVARNGLASAECWNSAIAEEPPVVTYPMVIGQDNGLKDLLQKIRTYGFCYIDETPATPNATQEVLERISFIRPTHYGGFYDFTADLASADTAYTNIPLGAHTDTTYFSDPAGLQAFHLLSHTDGSGGASLLVDGFSIARQLRQQDPEAYRTLSTTYVYAHASGNEGISIQPYKAFPVLEHDPATGFLLRVRWNTSDRARIEAPIKDVGTWYDAARKWDQLVKKRENEYWEQLVPGRVLVFDNWRVMHGRSGFTGKRRICGGYINRDDWISKYKMLRDAEGTLERLGTD